MSPNFLNELRSTFEQRAVLESLRPDLPGLRAVVPDDAVAEAPAAPFREPSPTADDACLIIYSSGTTGWPKGLSTRTPTSLPASAPCRPAGASRRVSVAR